MATIRSIETMYNGYRFRSRLEARWAVFFDAIGVHYEYEPEGYVLEDGTCYLPDFWLPDLRAFVEVKREGLPEDERRNARHKLHQLLDGEVRGCECCILTNGQDDYDVLRRFPNGFDEMFITSGIPGCPEDGWGIDVSIGVCAECQGPLIAYEAGTTFGEYIFRHTHWIGLCKCNPANPVRFVAKVWANYELESVRGARFEHGEQPHIIRLDESEIGSPYLFASPYIKTDLSVEHGHEPMPFGLFSNTLGRPFDVYDARLYGSFPETAVLMRNWAEKKLPVWGVETKGSEFAFVMRALEPRWKEIALELSADYAKVED